MITRRTLCNFFFIAKSELWTEYMRILYSTTYKMYIWNLESKCSVYLLFKMGKSRGSSISLSDRLHISMFFICLQNYFHLNHIQYAIFLYASLPVKIVYSLRYILYHFTDNLKHLSFIFFIVLVWPTINA